MSAAFPTAGDIRSRVMEVITRVRTKVQSLRPGAPRAATSGEVTLMETIFGQNVPPVVSSVQTRVKTLRTSIATKGLIGGVMAQVAPSGFIPFSERERVIPPGPKPGVPSGATRTGIPSEYRPFVGGS